MRKLASIQRIDKIEPIEGADKIELASVLGWKCVVPKDNYNEGDICIYFEIDSFLPIRDCFEFLRNSSYKNNDFMGEGFRIRTQKFRGQISQGLVMKIEDILNTDIEYEIGQDVTELIGVKEWQMPEIESATGTIKGNLPDGVVASDEVRIQAEPKLLEQFGDLPYYISTKMDGTSSVISIDCNGAFHACSHHREFKDDGKSAFFELVKIHDCENKLKEYMKNHNISSIMVAGEYCGEGIQKNRLKLNHRNWFIFTVREDEKRVGLSEMERVAELIGFNTVPIEEIDTGLKEKYPTIEALLERADGFYECGNRKEGIVIRPVEPVYCNLISSSLSVKVINNKYLLKNED